MRKLRTMLQTDTRRMFGQPLFYIMFALALAVPVLVLVMTSGLAGTPDAGMSFVNTWQMIGTIPAAASASAGASAGAGAGAMAMDMSSMMNINMLYFFGAVLSSIFIAEDFRSGYAKNLFTVRAKKGSYAASKIIVCSIATSLLFIAFFIGSIIGGNISGLSFAMTGFSAFNILMSMLGKIFIIPMFSAIYVIAGAIAKKKTWLSLCLSLAISMLFFMIIPMMTGLTASVMNAFMCLAGGILFSLGFGAAGNIILKKTDLV